MRSKTRVLLSKAVVNNGSPRCKHTELFPGVLLMGPRDEACRDLKEVVTSTTTTRTPWRCDVFRGEERSGGGVGGCGGDPRGGGDAAITTTVREPLSLPLPPAKPEPTQGKFHISLLRPFSRRRPLVLRLSPVPGSALSARFQVLREICRRLVYCSKSTRITKQLENQEWDHYSFHSISCAVTHVMFIAYWMLIMMWNWAISAIMCILCNPLPYCHLSLGFVTLS